MKRFIKFMSVVGVVVMLSVMVGLVDTAKAGGLYPRGVPDRSTILDFPFSYKLVGTPFYGKHAITQTGNDGYSHKCDGTANYNCGALDVDLREGTQVLAVADGKVRVYEDRWFGTYIIMDHPKLAKVSDYQPDKVHSFYAHLSRTTRNINGRTVSRGTVIGESGSTGSGTAAHLHFGMSLSFNNEGEPVTYPLSLNNYPDITWNNPDNPDEDPCTSNICGWWGIDW